MKKYTNIFLCFTTLLCCLISCTSENEAEEIKVGRIVFKLDGKTAYSGDTIHVIDKLENYEISWHREDGSKTDYDDIMGSIDGNKVFLNGYYDGYISFECYGPTSCELHGHDAILKENLVLYISIDEMDLKKQMKMTQISSWTDINGTTHNGPFLVLETDKNIGSSRIEILSYGVDEHSCEPNTYWYTYVDCDSYHGKLNGSYIWGKPNFYFYIFKYGNNTHEIRLYTDGRGYLWDGEWNEE